MSAKNGSIRLVAGNSNPALAQEIANRLNLPLAKASVRRFADNEIFVEILENVRGSERVRHSVDVISGQRPSDGIADHHRCAAPVVRAPHHGGDSLISATPGRTEKSVRARRSRPSLSPT